MSTLRTSHPKLNKSIRLIVYAVLMFAAALFLISLRGPTKKEIGQTEFQPRVRLGNEVFVHNFPEALRTKRLGLVINHTSALPDGTPLVRGLVEKGIRVTAFFSPEHGFSGVVEGGQNVIDSQLETIPIHSLYGKIKKPTADQMQQIDAFVYDIQDVGTRFYTYITTLKYVLEAAAEVHLPVYVLDRPNPAGGIIVEGPILQPEFESFIGALPIPIRYGLTCGELALMMKGEGWVPTEVDLHVIKMENWQRSYFWDDTGLPWIPTSPNIPSAETAIIFPGTGLIGGIRLNQGLGTPHPFLQFGAPWLDPDLIIRSLDEDALLGINLESVNFTPRSIPGKITTPIYQDTLCYGLKVEIVEKDRFLPVKLCLSLLKILKLNYPEEITPISSSLSLLFGTDHLSRYLKGSMSYETLLNEIKIDEENFLQRRTRYLLYEPR